MTLELETFHPSVGVLQPGIHGFYSPATVSNFALFWGARNSEPNSVPENHIRVSGPADLEKNRDFFGAKATFGRKSRNFSTQNFYFLGRAKAGFLAQFSAHF